MTRRRSMRSSTTRKRPSVSVTAATVISGWDMTELYSVAAKARLSAAAGGAQAVLGRARVPDLVEFLQVEARDRRIVDVRDTVPGVGAHAVDDGAVIRNEICGGALAGI